MLRERIQIGRRLNRSPPKLEGDSYSEGLRALVRFALESDPRMRPTMAEILQHDYLADTEEVYPISSLAELVRIYYQWSQRGGQRVSLFNPGGAQAAEMPENSFDDQDWNFSTTDDFEKRYSIVDPEAVSASLASLQAALQPREEAQPSTLDPFDDPSNESVMTEEDKANFNERVKRGATAMERLFDEAQPGYEYVTKHDFVPVQDKIDLPLRPDTDRSSVASTFIDLNLGDFDSSHYAAPTVDFQLAGPETLRANRLSNRVSRHSGNSVPQNPEYLTPKGSRPPTLDWKFPSHTIDIGPADSAASDAAVQETFKPRDPKRDTMTWMFPSTIADQDGNHQETFKPHEPKRDTMTWTFPSIITEDQNSSHQETLKLHDPKRDTKAWTFPATTAEDQDGPPPDDEDVISVTEYDRETTRRQSRFLDVSGHERMRSESSPSTSGTADTDPFRLDHPAVSPHSKRSSLAESVIIENDNLDTSSIGAPPDDDDYLQDDKSLTARNTAKPIPATLSTPVVAPAPESSEASSTMASTQSQLEFPVPVPPSAESLMESASDSVIISELDRLLQDFLHGLAVTGETLVNTEPGGGAQVFHEEPEYF